MSAAHNLPPDRYQAYLDYLGCPRNRHMAEEAFPLASKMIRQHTWWDERADG